MSCTVKKKSHSIYNLLNEVPSDCQSNVLVSFGKNRIIFCMQSLSWFSVFKVECNHCSDRETCTFY